MMRVTILLIAVIFQMSFTVNGQTGNVVKQNTTKAEYLAGNLAKIIEDRITYPEEAIKNNVKGDVLLSFVINSSGRLDSLEVTESPVGILSYEAKSAINRIKNIWKPCTVNGKKVNKRYSIVFRFRLYKNKKPPTYIKRADKLFNRDKYKKALKLYNKAIEDNRYNYKLFESLAETKDMLGDKDGAEADFKKVDRLIDNIMVIVDVVVVRTTHMNSVI